MQIIAVSHSTADIMHQAGVHSDKLTICHNGVVIEDICRQAQAPGTPDALPRQAGEVIFLLPATVQRNKGQHLAIAALAKVRSQNAKVRLWIAGGVTAGSDSGYLDELKELAENLGVADCVHFLGWRDDIYRLIAASDVVMLASQAESFGMVLAEAMAIGKPCIGPAVGGVPEVIEDGVTGAIFAPGDAGDLADKMLRMANDDKLRWQMATAGRQRVEQNFTADRQADMVTQVLKHGSKADPGDAGG
jgi:glycosyltransferase involved in cell wall biosynthesis